MKEKIEENVKLQNEIRLYNMVSKDCGQKVGWMDKDGKLGKRCRSDENEKGRGICNVESCPIIQLNGNERKKYLDTHHVG